MSSAGERKLVAHGIAVGLSMRKRHRAHVAGLAKQLEEYFDQLTDERLDALYQKLFAQGWTGPEPMPLTTRNADQHIKKLIMDAVSHEQIARRGGAR